MSDVSVQATVSSPYLDRPARRRLERDVDSDRLDRLGLFLKREL